MKSLIAFIVAVCVTLSSAAWAQSSLSNGPVSPETSGSERSTTDRSSSPVGSPTSAGEGGSGGASGSSAPRPAPQEKQDARESENHSPSQQNDPGGQNSPPADDK